jgi:hypothetical protein
MRKKIDAEKILQTLSVIRESIPQHMRRPNRVRKKSSDGAFEAASLEDFELLTVADALEELSDEISDSVAFAREQALAEALKIYYAAEELAKDPAHADLIPHLEEMRQAYQRDFGVPIPPKK